MNSPVKNKNEIDKPSSSVVNSKIKLPIKLESSRVESKTADELIKETFITGCPKRTALDFKFVRNLGEGAYSQVFLGQEIQSKKEFAVKVLDKKHLIRNQKMDAISREKNIMCYLTQTCQSHPFVCQLYTSFHDFSRIYFVMEFVDGGDLSESLCHFGSFDLSTTQFFASEILCGLNFLHDRNIVHRDLKPENILIRMNGHISITDFGSAQAINDLILPTDGFTEENQSNVQFVESRSPSPLRRHYSDDEDESTARRTTFVGTAFYVSPEMLADGDVGAPADIWGLGCIIFQCLAGQPPFRAVNQYHLMRKIQTLDFSFPEGFATGAIEVIQRILVSDPKSRPNSDELKKHEFFGKIDWENITTKTPPVLHAYIPATFGEQEYYSNIAAVEPGLDDKAMLRLMKIGNETNDSIPSTPTNNDNLECLSAEMVPRSDSQTERLQIINDKKLEEQRTTNQFHIFTNNMLILKQGYLEKKRGLFSRRRMFILTEGPHLLYIDVPNMVLKGEIPWTPCMQVEFKNSGTFFIHTPNRVYYLFDTEKNAANWCKAIEEVRIRYADQIEQTFTTAMDDGTFGLIYGKKKSRKEMMREQKALRRKQEKEEKKALKAELLKKSQASQEKKSPESQVN